MSRFRGGAAAAEAPTRRSGKRPEAGEHRRLRKQAGSQREMGMDTQAEIRELTFPRLGSIYGGIAGPHGQTRHRGSVGRGGDDGAGLRARRA